MALLPTKEQDAAIETFGSKRSLKINAYAGTGKTATLNLMARSTKRKGTYIAFNKAIADEARSAFPSNVECRTSHSLAFRATMNLGFSKDQMLGKLNPMAIAQTLDLTSMQFKQKRISETQIGYLVGETIRNFSYSAHKEIEEGLVPLPGSLSLLSEGEQARLTRSITTQAIGMWERMKDVADESVPLGHDGYFKLWSLSKPNIRSDFCLLDEAQDSNPALLSILEYQPEQVVYVGDRFQQIYEWRGAENAMQTVETENSLLLSQSFRFGNDIAQIASKVIQLIDSTAVVYGNPDIGSKIGCTNPTAILSRTNASLVAYMMGALSVGRSPMIIGGISELKWMLQDVKALKGGRSASHPEFFGFRNWQDVLEFVEQPEGQQLVTFVSIVGEFGEDQILAALNRTATNHQEADLYLSTTHKAKGLEWDYVMLANDYSEPIEVTTSNKPQLSDMGCTFFKHHGDRNYAISPEEVRILYVAATRGKLAIQLPEWCESFFGVHQPKLDLRFQLPSVHRSNTGKLKTGSALKQSQTKTHSAIWWILALAVLATILLFQN